MTARNPFVAALVAVAIMACPTTGQAASEADLLGLETASCPPDYETVFARSYSELEQEAALAGDFDVLLGRRALLAPPVDWGMDPYESRSWRHWLNTLGWWMDSLFYIYRQGGPHRLEALAQARDLALDWIASNEFSTAEDPDATWSAKVTADRTPYLAYLTRAAACEGLLTDDQAGVLVDALRAHAEHLVEHHPATDHGLYTDYGLALLADYLYFLDEAEGWRQLAIERFGPSLLKRFDAPDRVWLANTPAYQAMVTNLLDLWLANVDPDPQLQTTAAQMRWGLGWFAFPDGELVPFGDHHTMVPFAPWVAHVGDGHRGFRPMPRAGYAVVKRRRSYFATKASFHFNTHKQADDLTFELFEGGHRVVTDSGHYHYDRGAWRGFQQSVQAHSVLSVDGEDFPFRDQEAAYGSGIEAAGRGAGWYGVLGANPLVRRQGVRHRRLFLYRPGNTLLVVDLVRSKQRHTYRRYFQLGPEISTAARGSDLVLSAPGFSGTIDSSGQPERRKQVRGQLDPIGGWSFPDYREKVPRWTVSYRSRARSANYLTAFGLDGPAPMRARLLSVSRRKVELAIRGGRKRRAFVTVSRRDGDLEIERAKRGGRRRNVP